MLALEFLGDIERSEGMLALLGHRVLQIGTDQVGQLVDRQQRTRLLC
jgi:hypothetical protein